MDADVWLCALDLAVVHGWHPHGLAEGSDALAYHEPAGQLFGDDDARDMARGLERALSNVSDDEVPLRGLEFGEEHTLELVTLASRGAPLPEGAGDAAREILSGSPKREAEELVAFLADGGFRLRADKD